MTDTREAIHTNIWQEQASTQDPFSAERCYCSGYDVYGDLLGKVRWVEYLYLLFRLQAPSAEDAQLLETLAVALANPGPRDHSVRAAMNAGVGGSTHASCLMAALAVGAGRLGGAREVYEAMQLWSAQGTVLSAWKTYLTQAHASEENSVWPATEHPPGFDPHGLRCATPVQQTLQLLAQCKKNTQIAWLLTHQTDLEQAAGLPLSMSGVAAVTLTALGFMPEQGEMLYLLLRLPGAAVHALEQERLGWRKYPFFGDALKVENDPANQENNDKTR